MRFLRHLQDRLNTPQTRALLSTMAARYPAAVVFLDLASEMLAGATMEDVSTVLYYKVLAVGRLLAQPQGGRAGATPASATAATTNSPRASRASWACRGRRSRTTRW